MDVSQIMFNTIIATSLVPMMQGIAKAVTESIQFIFTYLFSFARKKYTQMNIATVKHITTLMISNNNIYWDNDGSTANFVVIKSIIHFIDLKGISCSSVDYKNYGHNLYSQPVDTVTFKRFNIKFAEEVISGENKQTKKIVSVTISSTESPESIDRFIRKCYKIYLKFTEVKEEEAYYMYMQIPTLKSCNVFKCYAITNATTFNDIFFPEKKRLISIMDKFIDGRLTKLNLLLHGVPGCGKTSVIKAMASYYRADIICVKLSCMSSDIEILDALHANGLQCDNSNDNNTTNRSSPSSRRIYVFEEIDTECEEVLSRKDKLTTDNVLVNKIMGSLTASTDKSTTAVSAGEASFNVETLKKSILNKMYMRGLTLGGILNALDGVLEFNSILIMTSNHPEKLDEALIRDGRITMKIELKHVDNDAARSILSKYFPDADDIDNIAVPSGVVTPAQLDGIAKHADTFEEAREGLNQLLAGHTIAL